MKLYNLMMIPIILISCSPIISDKDGDGISDGNRFIEEIYKDRKDRDFHYFVRQLLRRSTSEITWFKGNKPLQVDYTLSPSYTRTIIKNSIVYQFEENSANKKFSIYEILTGTESGNFVVLALEPIPIFDYYHAILLISKTTFNTIEDTRTYGNNNEIPQLSITIPFLDLVFDPDSIVIEDDNMKEHVTAIVKSYELLEIFGDKSYTEKQRLLESYDYRSLLN